MSAATSELNSIFGPTMAGTIVSGWLFGIICVLAYQYYVHYPKDHIAIKLCVALVVFLQGLFAADVSAMSYYYLVTKYNEPEALAFAVWEWPTFIILKTLTAFFVQVFYIYRVQKLTGSWLVAVAALILALGNLGFGLAGGAVADTRRDFAAFTSYTFGVVGWLGCAAACDLLLTFAQVFFLWRHGSSDLRGTQRTVKVLTVYIVSTGALTSIASIIELSTFARLGFNVAEVFVNYIIGDLYVLSLLANLGVRRKLGRIPPGTYIGTNGTESTGTGGGTLQFKAQPTRVFVSTDHSTTGDVGTTYSSTTEDKTSVPEAFKLQQIA